MWPDGVVKGLNIDKYGIGGLFMGDKVRKIESLAFKAAKEVFGDGIVIGVAFAAHALAEVGGGEGGTETDGGVLNPTVRMKNEARSRLLTPYCHGKSVQD